MPGRTPVGSHSHTRPSSCSSHDSQVPQGVGPPAQLEVVPARTRYARSTAPLGANSTPETPPPPGAGISELATRIQPPSGPPPGPRVGNVAWPSVAPCQT